MRGRSSGRGNVIRVDFGAGGDRSGRDSTPPTIEALTTLFSARDAARLTGLSIGQLRALDRAGVASPGGKQGARRAYTFADLVVLRTAAALRSAAVRPHEVAAVVSALRRALPRVTRPLAELRIVSDGKRIVVRAREGSFDPLTGQMLIDFDVRSLRDDVVRELGAKPRARDARQAYELYVRASECDEDPETLDEAESLYRRAIALDPWLAIAYTNLGNVRFRRGHSDEAALLYEKALGLDPHQPEAHYNLGYLLLERAEAAAAVPYLEAAVRGDGSFADAYFYLAMALESVGEHGRAAPAWQRYLDLDPGGSFADVARRHLP